MGIVMQGLTPLHEAQKIVLAAAQPLAVEKVGLLDALGRVLVEDTEPSQDSVRIFKEVERGANIRPQGEDVKKGDCIIAKGTQIRPAEAGMLAILAKSFVPVYQRPRVAILATGDELADLDERF